MDTISSDQVVETALKRGNKVLAASFGGDVLFLKAPMRQTIDDAVKDEIEEIKGAERKSSNKIIVMVETTGGYVEVVERIVSVLRQHYKTVEYVVPNYAYSAGTVLGRVDKVDSRII